MFTNSDFKKWRLVFPNAILACLNSDNDFERIVYKTSLTETGALITDYVILSKVTTNGILA